MLAVARNLLVTSDRELRDQKALATSHRRVRDDAFKTLFPHVMGVRDTFRGACGPEVVERVGFAMRMPEQPSELFEQAQHLTARLSAPGLELPIVRYKGVTLDPVSFVEELAPLVQNLGQALEDVSREERRIEALKIAKDEALDVYTRTFLWVAQSAEALFKLADLPAVAKRVRPSTRRAGLTDEVESEGPEGDSEGAETPIEESTQSTTEVKARPDIPPVESSDDLSAE